MELVLNNPFRVLGLPATASTRDITKRISDLETFAELGKAKTYPHDFPGLGSLDRSLEAIKDAARKIEQAEGRLFHSFFWFRAGDSVDELALDSLAAGNVDEAVELWDKQLGKKGTKKYTWRLNRGVLRLVRANGRTLDKDEMDEALEDLGFVIDDDLDDSIQEVLAGNESGVNRESLWRRVVDELVGLVQSYSTNPYGKNSVRIVESLWSFPSEARDYASSKILNPLIEEVNEAIKVSEDLRANDDLESPRKSGVIRSRIFSERKFCNEAIEVHRQPDHGRAQASRSRPGGTRSLPGVRHQLGDLLQVAGPVWRHGYGDDQPDEGIGGREQPAQEDVRRGTPQG